MYIKKYKGKHILENLNFQRAVFSIEVYVFGMVDSDRKDIPVSI
jgi:hypothetical protein